LFSKVYSGSLRGIDGYLVQVEADVGDGLPGFHMVGYLSSEVKEAEERVRTAMKNSQCALAARKITVNLSPANVRKDGTAFDLPIAVAVLAAYGSLADAPRAEEVLRESAFIGELGLDGSVKPVHGVLPLVLMMESHGIRRCFLPQENVAEGLAAEQMEVVGVATLGELITLVKDPERICPAKRPDGAQTDSRDQYPVDFSEVAGQELMRRATEVAVAGQHNILYLGTAGSGKSMVARRIPTIMPRLSREERLEISKVYSICGMLPPGHTLMDTRPFRAPHHTASAQALTGGGRKPRPGEISLATRGVLFLDELAEFRRGSLEILRQPLEENSVTVARVYGAYSFPAHFMLAAAMNPCPCGFYPDRSRCTCTELQVRRYLGKISRPLLDRIDICVEAAPVGYEELRSNAKNESSAEIRRRVERAREIQQRRFAGSGLYFNSEMKGSDIRQYCVLGEKEEQFLMRVFREMQLSARGCDKILKVARTIADLDVSERITAAHLSEAVGYRSIEEKYWGKGM